VLGGEGGRAPRAWGPPAPPRRRRPRPVGARGDTWPPGGALVPELRPFGPKSCWAGSFAPLRRGVLCREAAVSRVFPPPHPGGLGEIWGPARVGAVLGEQPCPTPTARRHSHGGGLGGSGGLAPAPRGETEARGGCGSPRRTWGRKSPGARPACRPSVPGHEALPRRPEDVCPRLPASSGRVGARELGPTAGLGAAPRFPRAGTGADPQPCHGPDPRPAQGDASALSRLAGMLGCRELVGGSPVGWPGWGAGSSAPGPPGWVMLPTLCGARAEVMGEGGSPPPRGCGAPQTRGPDAGWSEDTAPPGWAPCPAGRRWAVGGSWGGGFHPALVLGAVRRVGCSQLPPAVRCFL